MQYFRNHFALRLKFTIVGGCRVIAIYILREQIAQFIACHYKNVNKMDIDSSITGQRHDDRALPVVVKEGALRWM